MKAGRADRIATIVFWSIGLVSMAILAFIILEIFGRGLVTAVSPSFFAGQPATNQAGGGVGPMIVSSLYLAALTMLISLPVSIGAAIYMAEYAREGKFNNFIRFCLDSLATLPSIVFGIFGLTLFVVTFKWSYCLLAGAFTLALLNLPILLRGAEESIKQVPQTYREASMSLGANRWITIKKVVLPSAMPGVITGTVLPIGRIMGEAAAVIYTTGLFIRAIPLSPFDPAAPLAGYIWYAQTEATVPDYRQIVNGGAAILLILVFLINFSARRFARFYAKRKQLEVKL
ncbi:MAG: phosphate ABC transporter, permease protein PstA [Actinobacteria bacterium RBG_19FT_COMBO_54_7]|uniref:Phosphate transport system permease protein PstA n=1 Tax=Candidatus Solincola sediminis TaxID=1797199 RepID=A0A1F2WF88_9ACTN|nr:MAG: phosphate ABC transporter, permease protein PstA [Candidatus Solincola sediminis]OFW57806.1 MAG: phosphate ABC transporter, permease protein PstA [Candidatus Solincola sediminis]OFW65682.1 MAG: phosphate ABC transporter, permease protein PstA [Actinobacteria bacterium RBG_19FT_COMBO_54_7]